MAILDPRTGAARELEFSARKAENGLLDGLVATGANRAIERVNNGWNLRSTIPYRAIGADGTGRPPIRDWTFLLRDDVRHSADHHQGRRLSVSFLPRGGE